MDRQATLDRIIAFIHAWDGHGQQRNGSSCRTSDGRNSAVGSLVLDEFYTAGLEARNPDKLPLQI